MCGYFIQEPYPFRPEHDVKHPNSPDFSSFGDECRSDTAGISSPTCCVPPTHGTPESPLLFPQTSTHSVSGFPEWLRRYIPAAELTTDVPSCPEGSGGGDNSNSPAGLARPIWTSLDVFVDMCMCIEQSDRTMCRSLCTADVTSYLSTLGVPRGIRPSHMWTWNSNVGVEQGPVGSKNFRFSVLGEPSRGDPRMRSWSSGGDHIALDEYVLGDVVKLLDRVPRFGLSSVDVSTARSPLQVKIHLAVLICDFHVFPPLLHLHSQVELGANSSFCFLLFFAGLWCRSLLR